MKYLLLVFLMSCCIWACQNNTISTYHKSRLDRTTVLEDTVIDDRGKKKTVSSGLTTKETAVYIDSLRAGHTVFYVDSLALGDTITIVSTKNLIRDNTQAPPTVVSTSKAETGLLVKKVKPPTGRRQSFHRKHKQKPLPKDVDGNRWTLNFPELAARINRYNDTIYVYNFWATWCKPCITELPHFERLYREYKDKKVKVVLVSLDFPELLNHKLIPYVKEHRLKSKVYLLDAGTPNEWINKVSKNWSGAIPATLVVHAPSKRYSFYEQSFDYEALEYVIKKSL